MTANRGRRNEKIGVVKSDKMDKTISVLIQSKVKDPQYGKYVLRNSVMKAHDEENKAKVGDKVCIYETRPLSKTKRWKLLKIIDQGARSK